VYNQFTNQGYHSVKGMARNLPGGRAKMKIDISAEKKECGAKAAKLAGQVLRGAIEDKGIAVFVAATGASQFEFLEALIAEPDIDWGKTAMFHLDEYLGLPDTHPASFRKYLKERLIEPVKPGSVNLVNGDNPNPTGECRRLGQLIGGMRVDAAFIGIGENGHIAFNDPPADFKTEQAFIVVELDEACRRQQLGEGWFDSLEEVPKKAISMSVAQIMQAKTIVCTAPDARKAQAVKDALSGEARPELPASILQQHADCHLFLDKGSASLLSRKK
jgi:glucosamine-6-phosphate deaminase